MRFQRFPFLPIRTECRELGSRLHLGCRQDVADIGLLHGDTIGIDFDIELSQRGKECRQVLVSLRRDACGFPTRRVDPLLQCSRLLSGPAGHRVPRGSESC